MPRNLEVDGPGDSLLYPTKHMSSAFSEQDSSGIVKLGREKGYCLVQLKKKSDFIYTCQLANERFRNDLMNHLDSASTSLFCIIEIVRVLGS